MADRSGSSLAESDSALMDEWELEAHDEDEDEDDEGPDDDDNESWPCVKSVRPLMSKIVT